MSTEKSKLPFAQRRENIGLPDHVYRQVAELERELAAANQRVEQAQASGEAPK